jgi:hypothetical protein
MIMDEAKLVEKLKLIEALFAGAATPGERVAADAARQRILDRLRTVQVEDPPVEYKFTMADMWSRRVLVALLRRYGIRPYRYRRQRYTTVMARVSARFVDETLWPQFQQLDQTLQAYLSSVTERVVSQVLSDDLSEAAVVSEPLALAPGGDPAPSEPIRRPADVGATPAGPGDAGGNGRASQGSNTSPSAKNGGKRKRRRGKGKGKRKKRRR